MNTTHKITNEQDGTEIRVTEFNGKFNVTMWDTDANAPLPIAYTGMTREAAIAKAEKIAAGSGPIEVTCGA